MIIAILLSIALAGGETAAAASAGAAQSPTPGAEQPLKPGERKIKVVCRNVNKNGSRFSTRQCTEVSADAKQTDIDQRAFEEVQNRPMINPPCNPGAGQSC